MIPQLIIALHQAGLDMTAEEIAETLWLSLQITEQGNVQLPVSMKQAEGTAAADSDVAANSAILPSLSSLQSKTTSDIYLNASSPGGKSTTKRPGVSFKSPAASALPGSLALARALRPLMRRVPSHIGLILDEQATIRQIAETNAKFWLPVRRPALARWLDVALVVDEGTSMMLWRQAITELQALQEQT